PVVHEFRRVVAVAAGADEDGGDHAGGFVLGDVREAGVDADADAGDVIGRNPSAFGCADRADHGAVVDGGHQPVLHIGVLCEHAVHRISAGGQADVLLLGHLKDAFLG